MCLWGEGLKPQGFEPLFGDFFHPKLCRKEESKYSVASALEGDCIPGDSTAPGNMPVQSGGGEPYGKCLESWSLLPHVVALMCQLSEVPGLCRLLASLPKAFSASQRVPPVAVPALSLLGCLCSFSVFLLCFSLFWHRLFLPA